jgi:hypothetical protein
LTELICCDISFCFIFTPASAKPAEYHSNCSLPFYGGLILKFGVMSLSASAFYIPMPLITKSVLVMAPGSHYELQTFSLFQSFQATSEGVQALNLEGTKGGCSPWDKTSRPGLFNPGEGSPGTNWKEGWLGPRFGLEDVEKKKFLTLSGLELRPFRCPVRSQLLYQLRCPDSLLLF